MACLGDARIHLSPTTAFGIWFEKRHLIKMYPCLMNEVLRLVDHRITSNNSDQETLALVLQLEDIQKSDVPWV